VLGNTSGVLKNNYVNLLLCLFVNFLLDDVPVVIMKNFTIVHRYKNTFGKRCTEIEIYGCKTVACNYNSDIFSSFIRDDTFIIDTPEIYSVTSSSINKSSVVFINSNSIRIIMDFISPFSMPSL